MNGFGLRAALVLPFVIAAPLCATAQPPIAGSPFSRALDRELEQLGLDEAGMQWGIVVWREGEGVLYQRAADTPRATASAIKGVVALDLLSAYPERLNQVPDGLPSLLEDPQHPAFIGFSLEQRARALERLTGRSYLELAHIMMGRTPATNDVYNAACNLIMIKSGGPLAIQRRVRDLNPAFSGFTLTHYMQTWNGDGDNRATPRSLIALYRGVSAGRVPGLDTYRMYLYRALLQRNPVPGSPLLHGKAGTLYPHPMVRVHAGFVDDAAGPLVFAVMGEIPDPVADDPGELFLRFMSAVDAVATICRDPAFFAQPSSR